MDKIEIEILLNHAFTLYEHVFDDDASEDLLKTCEYFIEEHNFDIDVLPENIREFILTKKAEDAKVEAQLDSAEDFPLDYIY